MRGYRFTRAARLGLCGLLGAACGEAMKDTGDSASAGGSSADTADASSGDGGTGASSVASDGTGSAGESTGTGGGSAETVGTSSTGDASGDAGTSTGGADGSTTMMVDTGDNSSGSTGDPIPPDQCPLFLMHEPCDADSTDALHAIGLNCTTLGGNFQDAINATALKNLDFQAPPPMNGKRTWQVAKAYGTFIDPNTKLPFWSAREGDRLLMLSSGLLPMPDAQGVVKVADGDVYNDAAAGGQWDSDQMPPPMFPMKGSPDPMGFANCDGANDCSNTLEDQWALGNGDSDDKSWFSFQLTAPSVGMGAPANAKGYIFDFAYFSAEFPEWVDTDFNDIFVVWQASEMYTGNVTFINGQPLTVTALWPIEFQGECEFGDPNCTGNDPHLAGTGFESSGGATSWYKATGGVKPGETFTLAFAIFDMGDSIYDTTALVDNFRWDCEGCIPNEVDSCGIEPQ